ncbi:MAG: GNAT family N-acetyltransferase [Candidatus Woesearchaeota archaeon]
MQVITEVTSEFARAKINEMFSRYGCAAEHTYTCYVHTIKSVDPNATPYILVGEDDTGVLASYEPKNNEYRLFTEILAPTDKKADLLKQFLDNIYSLDVKPKKIWLELETETRRSVIRRLKDTAYRCNDINYTLIWPVFEMDKWDGDLMQGGEWKDLRYYWNKFFRDHKVEFLTADKVDKDELKNLVYDWKKNRTTGDIAYVDYYIKAIEHDFDGYDVTRIMVVDGKIAAITAGFETRPGYYYSSIGLYDVNLPRCNDIANLDDLINLKKLGYKAVDFGGIEKSKLDFKKKFRPTRYYKTHVFSIVLNGDGLDTKNALLEKNVSMDMNNVNKDSTIDTSSSNSHNSDKQLNSNRIFIISQTKPSQWQDIKKGVFNVEKEVFEEALRYDEEDVESFILDNTLNYIVWDGDKIVGYLMSCPIENDERYEDDPNFGKNDTIHIESMALLPEYRGKSLGQKLFLKCIEDAKILGYKRAVMDATSEAMVGLGLKHGFVKVKFYEEWQGERSSWYMEKLW